MSVFGFAGCLDMCPYWDANLLLFGCTTQKIIPAYLQVSSSAQSLLLHWLGGFSLGCTGGRCCSTRLKNIKAFVLRLQGNRVRSADDPEGRRLRRCGCEVPPGLCFCGFLQPLKASLHPHVCDTHVDGELQKVYSLFYSAVLARYWLSCPVPHHLMATGVLKSFAFACTEIHVLIYGTCWSHLW